MSNVVAAFGLGNSALLGLLKELFSLSDSDLSQRLSNLPANGGDEAVIVQKVARLRGVARLFPCLNKHTNLIHSMDT